MEILGHLLEGPSPRLGRHVVAWWPTAGALAQAASQAKGKGGQQGLEWEEGSCAALRRVQESVVGGGCMQD